VNQHRDSLALYVGYDSLAQYIAVAENESVGRVKFQMLQVRLLLFCWWRVCHRSHGFWHLADPLTPLPTRTENDTTLWPTAAQGGRLMTHGQNIGAQARAQAVGMPWRPAAATHSAVRTARDSTPRYIQITVRSTYHYDDSTYD
jgi:hypothetical protein